VGATLNRTITSRDVVGLITGALGAVALAAEVLGAFGDPGMSGAILEAVVEAVDDVDDVDDADDVDDVDDVDWANAAVTPAIRNSSNDFFIR
jgi:hypothetical protein